MTRIADLTNYDRVGIPVASATRPDVDESDITVATGKGLTRQQARLGALMEAVESAGSRDIFPRICRQALGPQAAR